MTIRGLRLRAIVLPLGMAFLSIAGVAWYGVVQIPAQGRYVNERNLRLLRTRAAQIKAKIDNFDHAIDHALESITQDGRTSPAEVTEGLREYVRLFSRGDLEIRKTVIGRTNVARRRDASGLDARKRGKDAGPGAESPESDAERLLRLAADPPVVMVQRDEGKSYLYIGASPDGPTGAVSKVLVRSSIEDVARYYLVPGAEFDAVFLTDRTGLVIAQSAAALNLARIDAMIDAAAQKTAVDQSPHERFASLVASSNVVDVKIGDAAYKLYVEPLQLSLKPLPPAGSGAEDSSGSERWLLCGLVRLDHFTSESAAISYTYLLWFSSVLAAICLGIPLVKLKVISPRERFSAHDSVWVAGAIFVGAGLLTTIAVDVYTFRYEFRLATNQRLRSVADALRGNLAREIDAIQQEFDELHHAAAKIFDEVKEPPKIVVLPPGRNADRRTDCRPQKSCEWELLEGPQNGGVTPSVYQYFDLASWNDVKGTQKVKWSTVRAITPFLNIREEKLPHYQELERAWRLGGTGNGRSSGISVLMSPTTSEPITVFWRAITTPNDDLANIGQSMSMIRPVALDRPILPNHVRFAVIDRDGRVMFHADGARILKESFFKECEDDPALRSAVQAGADAFLTAYYLGKPTRMYVTPLVRDNAFADPRWSLVVFQDYTVIETLNLETLTIALTLFTAFGALLALASWLLHWFTPGRWTKWFWPDPKKRGGYVAAGLLNAAVISLFVVTSGRLESASLIAMAAVLTCGAVAATWRIITRADDPRKRAVGWREFFWARAAFLFVIAGLPAIVCFRVAYDFEVRALVRSEELHETIDRAARKARIESRVVDRLALRTRNRINSYVSARVARTWDDDQVPLFPTGTLDVPLQKRSAQLDELLGLIHRPYNEIAVDLKAASASLGAVKAGTPPLPVMWLAAIAGALVCVFYAALRWLVKPMFAAEPSPAAPAKRIAPALDLAMRGIIVGPPGSGKSTRLANDPKIRIFDIRTLAYHERRRRHAKPAQMERRVIAQGALARVAGSIGVPSWTEPAIVAPASPVRARADAWAASFDYTTLPQDEQTAIGIDHLDHRLDEPEFRAQTLKFLEELVYCRNRRLRVASDRDPIACIADSPLTDAHQASIELDRWARVLQSFRKENAGVADELDPDRIGAMAAFADDRIGVASPAARAVFEESRRSPQLMRIGEALVAAMTAGDGLDAEEARRDFGAAAEPYYQAVWHTCTMAERLTLRQLAEEGVVNPRNQTVVRQLIRAGLIVRDPILRVMNETFRRFVLQAATTDQVSAWERTGVQVPWASIETALVTLVIGVAGLLVVTQEQLLGAWIGFVPTIAPAMPTVWRFLASAQRGVKGEGPLSGAVHA